MKKKAFLIALASSLSLLVAVPALAQQDAAADSSGESMVSMNVQNGMNWFGGEVYTGKPALKATAALVRAGGGAEDFSFSKALVAMLGQDTVNAEVAKLNKQYGEADVKQFLSGMTYAINSGLRLATAAGISLPKAPADLKGPKLAKALVKAGQTDDGTFWAGHMFDVAISHTLHNAVMSDIEANVSHQADKNTHKILNQAMYDVAQALGMKDVKLASFH